MSGGLEDCFETPEEIINAISSKSFVPDNNAFIRGYSVWPIIPYSYDTPVDRPGAAPLPQIVKIFLEQMTQSGMF